MYIHNTQYYRLFDPYDLAYNPYDVNNIITHHKCAMLLLVYLLCCC